jgi:thiol-disulfide isomerase/thioredoxin
MNTAKLMLLSLTALIASFVSSSASEFPKEWFWDSDPAQRAAHAALEGKPMPSLAGLTEWLNGGMTADKIKGKVLVVDFYATWCGPCMAAIPHNNEMLKQYKDKGLVLIGVCTSSRGQEKFVANANQHRVAYPAARDASQKVAKAWAVQYYPTYAVVDRKGIVRAVGLQTSRVEEVVKKLLAEPAS